ncbi:RagB/SusD family nutrient uptake outer membrane protein [Olivibacter jilunii]|uniref:RagB/SusD family nutrient uptake outer membrane protein n=1 Tax=Olivibacter jilunii TaxID=985016 RepID=UPI00102F8416|nr:RagB/SusD family nutrient uptake outer membrane protein [Olivibacter jilunii]
MKPSNIYPRLQICLERIFYYYRKPTQYGNSRDEHIKYFLFPIKKKLRISPIFSSILLLSISSCTKLIDIDPPLTNTTVENAFKTDATAVAVVTSIYTKLSAGTFGSGELRSTSALLGLSADELKLYENASNQTYIDYYQNSLNSSSVTADFWSNCYQMIYLTNSAIEGLSTSNSLSGSVKQQLLGEVKFVRAFCYFYLVNLYGDLPLVLSTDFSRNSNLPRTPKTEIWKQIIDDLIQAKDLLSRDYLDASLLNISNERIRPTKWAAIALLARAYLYTKEWTNAEIQSSELIENSGLFQLVELQNVFLANSMEAVWQLQPVYINSTEEARFFKIPETGPGPDWPVSLSIHLLKQFTSTDGRRNQWIDSLIIDNVTIYYPTKYKSVATAEPTIEYTMVLRLSEQLLIRAEARAQLDKLDDAASDLNRIHLRSNPEPIQVENKQDLIDKILKERQIELFTEWGHRWLDLKRSGTIDQVMQKITPEKGGIWNSNWQWYPISATELSRNTKLVQNQGY